MNMICIVVALKAEALPLIEALNLQSFSNTSLFPLFVNEKLTLIISGVGKIQAGAACSYLASLYGKEEITGFVNVGIGGHVLHPLGKAFLIDQILDAESGHIFFPSFPFSPPHQTETCLTVSNPEYSYQKTAIYDMEASGFFSIASKICPLELIHLFKVISDNSHHDAHQITPKKVQNWMGRQISSIKKLLSLMETLSQNVKKEKTPFLSDCLKRWHFTHCQRDQLTVLLKRWALLCPEKSPLSEEFLTRKKSKEALCYLESILNSLPLPFP